MSRETRQRALLGALLALFAVLVWVRWSGSGEGRRPGGAHQQGGSGLELETSELLDLRVAALDAKAAVYSPGRDPFSYGKPPAPERPPQPQPQPQPERRPRRRRNQNGAQAKPAGPTLPAVDVKFLGSFGRAGDRIAVFSDGSDILNAKVGDVLKDKFIVDAIGFESADLKFVGFPDAPGKRLAAGGGSG